MGSNMIEIFIVIGEIGEYSDWDYWIVGAYIDEGEAKANIKRAEDWYAKNYDRENPGLKNPHDPEMKISWSYRPEWSCKKIECIDKER